MILINADTMVEVPAELIEEIQYHLHMYDNSKSKANAGHHLVELFNRVGDLSTYHPGYDENAGTLPWEREDEE